MLTLAWERFSAHWPVLAGAQLLVFVVSQGLVWAVNATMRVPTFDTRAFTPHLGAMGSDVVSGRQIPGIVISVALGAFFSVGTLRMSLDAARGRTPELGTLFMGGDRFLPMLAARVLTFLAAGAGCCLLLVPGLVIYLGLFVTWYYVADSRMGPIDALRASWLATRGHKGDLCILLLSYFGISLLGVLSCCVGIVGSEAFCAVATAIIYLRLSGLGAPAAEPAAGT